jgi:hypothetical protein
MKAFISQPMRGRTDEEILAERNDIECRLREEFGEVEVLETFYDDFGPDAKPLEYLARSISDLAKADVAYFAKGWQNARGCKIENMCAIEYGIHTIEAY